MKSLSPLRKYHVKYIGIIDNSMGILTRDIEMKPKSISNIQSSIHTRKNSMLNTTKQYNELESGIPNPRKYDVPIINSCLYGSRLPSFRRIDHKPKDYKSINNYFCKNGREGFQGSKITFNHAKRYRKTFEFKSDGRLKCFPRPIRIRLINKHLQTYNNTKRCKTNIRNLGKFLEILLSNNYK